MNAMGSRSLALALSAVDPRDTDALEAVAGRFSETDGYLDTLIEHADADESESIAATWLIKRNADAGGMLSAPQTSELVSRLDGVSAWESRLHLCQSVGSFECGRSDAASLVRWLTPMLGHERPFLRAWSLDGLCRVASDHKRYRHKACEATDDAGDDAKASVRARVRRLHKEFPYLNAD